MEYSQVAEILNRHIFDGDRLGLLAKIAINPERYIGLFRPTKPKAKLLQNVLQSHEIRFGDAMENLIEVMLQDLGYKTLDRYLMDGNGNGLSIDQYFTDGKKYYFMEQKVRDDHDSTKKRGQISNFENKLDILYEALGDQVEGMMYFIDPDLSKNKNYYIAELNRIQSIYEVEVNLFYGREFFDYLGYPEQWDLLVNWLIRWKEEMPDFPDINMDATPYDSFLEIKDLSIPYWSRLLENEEIWSEGIIKVLFENGDTLRLVVSHFKKLHRSAYSNLARLLDFKIKEYYG